MKKISLNCPINNMGYGITSYNVWKALSKKLDITLFLIHDMYVEQQWDKESLLRDIYKQQEYNSESLQNPCLKIWHPSDLSIKPCNKGLYSTYSFFEVDKLAKEEISSYSISDIIFAPTSWAKDVLIDNGLDENKIKIAPSGVDRDVFTPDIKIDEADVDKDKYIFLNIGKWEIRKGHDLLVHIFNKAFSENDDVELWMLNSNAFLSEKENKHWEKMYKNSKLGDKIRIFPRLPTQEHIAKLIKLSNCGIYPARAEGWNNEALETMSMNKPIILTNYSGHTQYANNKNSYLVDVNTLEDAVDGKFFHGRGRWASLTTDAIDQCIEHMKYVYKNRITDNAEGVKTASQFSWNHTASQMIQYLYE